MVEIENLLLTHPAIREIALVPLPHDRLGETACACIVLQPDVAANRRSRTSAISSARMGSPEHFYPESLRVLAQLPRTPSGKIQKFALRDQVLS